MQTVTLKPAFIDGEPLKVRKPQGGYLTQGELIVLTTYWRRRRRRRRGRVDETQPDASAPADAPATPVKSASAKGAKPVTE